MTPSSSGWDSLVGAVAVGGVDGVSTIVASSVVATNVVVEVDDGSCVTEDGCVVVERWLAVEEWLAVDGGLAVGLCHGWFPIFRSHGVERRLRVENRGVAVAGVIVGWFVNSCRRSGLLPRSVMN